MNNNPFIIWTFRRSGGTNLGQALFLNSTFQGVEHEPFNGDRVFGHIIKKWRKDRDMSKLYSELDVILEKKPLIKHCLEIMPSELNLALLELSIKHGYNHLFLYREEAQDRLLSLNYSLKTNVWGKEHIKTRPFDKAVYKENIDINNLLNHEQHCRKSMLDLYQEFKARNVEPISVSFEQLYKSEFVYSSQLVKRLFIELNGSDKAVTDDFLHKTLKGGKQGTNTEYLVFPNSDLFVIELKKLPLFQLYLPKKVTPVISDKLDYLHFELWVPLRGVKDNEMILHGALLSERGFKIIDDAGFEVELIRNLPSARIGGMFNDNPDAKNCRFISTTLLYNEKIKVLPSSL